MDVNQVSGPVNSRVELRDQPAYPAGQDSDVRVVLPGNAAPPDMAIGPDLADHTVVWTKQNSGTTAILIGVFCGIASRALATAVSRRAEDFAGNVGGAAVQPP